MRPGWARGFKPIRLSDGRAIGSLAQARAFIASLPEISQSDRQWKYVGDLLARAADQNEKYSTMDARAQLSRALRADGFM
jgi:hypothetical protein